MVDDDVRNVYALTSALEDHGAEVRHAPRTGGPGIELLNSHARDVELVLMDIMMPDMDGYEAIAGHPGHGRLRGPADHRPHRQGHAGRPGESLAAGASDYVTKPVDIDQLLVALRLWLDR